MTRKDRRRLRNKIDDSSTHWLWEGSTCKGYPIFYCQGRNLRAHRLIYELCNGEISPGLDLHHRCGHRLCVRPRHLIPLPHSKHMTLHGRKGAWSGERNGAAKLTNAEVLAYRFLSGLGIPKPSLARAAGIPYRTMVYAITEGWTHLPNPKTYQEWEKVLFD
jgi:hypothetical protein